MTQPTDTEHETLKENELARRRFVLGKVDHFWEMARLAIGAFLELSTEADLTASEILDVVFNPDDVGERASALVQRFHSYLAGALEAAIAWKVKGDPLGDPQALLRSFLHVVRREPSAEPESLSRMQATICRLLDEAPKMTDGRGNVDETQAPAVQCHVILRGQLQPISGALSLAPEGTLKFLQIVTVNNKQTMLEAFFDYDDVVSVMVEREVKAERSSSIFMG